MGDSGRTDDGTHASLPSAAMDSRTHSQARKGRGMCWPGADITGARLWVCDVGYGEGQDLVSRDMADTERHGYCRGYCR